MTASCSIAHALFYALLLNTWTFFQSFYFEDLTVNGLIIGDSRLDTYYGKFGIVYKRFQAMKVTPDIITVNEANIVWFTSQPLPFPDLDLVLLMPNDDELQITIGPNIKLIFICHKYIKRQRKGDPEKVRFLGFYAENSKGLSHRTQGIIGMLKFKFYRIYQR